MSSTASSRSAASPGRSRSRPSTPAPRRTPTARPSPA
jgi:hypothetical protein